MPGGVAPWGGWCGVWLRALEALGYWCLEMPGSFPPLGGNHTHTKRERYVMATSRKNTNTPAPMTIAQINAQTIALTKAIGSADADGKALVAKAQGDAFTQSVDAFVKLGEHLVNNVAAHIDGALTGDNVAKAYAKDGVLGAEMTAEDRDAVKSKNTYTRALRAYQNDSAEMRALFLNGPASLVGRCKALVGIDGHSPASIAYTEWLAVMNMDAPGKALVASFVDQFNVFRADDDNTIVYVKRKPAAQTGTAKVSFKSADMPVLGSVISADRDALTAMVKASRFDFDIAAADLGAYAEYFAARYRLSLMDAPTDAPVAPAAKVTTIGG